MDQLLKDPDSIFKYVPFSIRTLEIFIKGGLWFGHPKNLNDPYEGEFLVNATNNLPDEAFLEGFYQHSSFNLSGSALKEKIDRVKKDIHIYYQDVYKYIKSKVKEEYGVSCFTKTPSEILMWTHYADSHTGMCLVFDKKQLNNSLKEYCPDVGVQDIEYEQSLASADLQMDEKNLYCKSNQEIILRKLDCWQYEKEVRFYCHFPNSGTKRWIFFDRKSLKGIIFGENMSENNRDTLMHLMSDLKGYEVKWGVAKKDLKKKEIRVEEIFPALELHKENQI